MASSRKFIAFDLGAESGRAILGTLDGKKLSLDVKHRFANPMSKINGHWHWNLQSQWEELKAGLKLASAGAGEISGVGVDTWGVDYGLLGSGGEILGNPYAYRDARTEGIMEKVFARVPLERIFEATGIQFMPFNTLFQLAAQKLAGSTALDAAVTILWIPDLFNYLFTGIAKTEFSIASTSQMYDPRRKEWALDLLAEMGLPTGILPEIVPSGSILGKVKKDVAEECGVEQMPVIAPACHDTGSAVAAVPAQGGNWCYISSGTWSLMGVETDRPIINDKTLKYNYTNEGGVGGSIRLLKNIMGLWLVQECRRHWKAQGNDLDYTRLTQMAAEARSFGTLIDPDHAPFLSPGQMPVKIEKFCETTRQKAPSGTGEFVRTCLESLALTYRKTLEGLEDIVGHRIEVIHIVGGGSQNELLNQMTADACGRTVVAGPIEGTSIGNILVQAMAVGQVATLADARAIVAASFTVKRYEPRETKTWDQAYTRFREILGK
jgi:sugar (pentulose or hexulose) kinase